MALISKGDPFLMMTLGFVKDNWLILVGYPWSKRFQQNELKKLSVRVLRLFDPKSFGLLP